MWQTNQNIGYYYVYRWFGSFLCILFLNILFWIVYCSFSFGFLLFPSVYNTTFFCLNVAVYWFHDCFFFPFFLSVDWYKWLNFIRYFNEAMNLTRNSMFQLKSLSISHDRIIFWKYLNLIFCEKMKIKNQLTRHIVRRALFVDLMLLCRLKWCVSNPNPIRSFLWYQLISNHPNYQLSRWLMMDCQRPTMLTAVYYLFRIYSKNDQHLWIIFRCSLHV